MTPRWQPTPDQAERAFAAQPRRRASRTSGSASTLRVPNAKAVAHSMSPDWSDGNSCRSGCAACQIDWPSNREVHCRTCHEHFGSWGQFETHALGDDLTIGKITDLGSSQMGLDPVVLDRWDAAARRRADAEMDQIARQPVTRASGRRPTLAEVKATVPVGWLAEPDPQGGHPWQRRSQKPPRKLALLPETDISTPSDLRKQEPVGAGEGDHLTRQEDARIVRFGKPVGTVPPRVAA
jgi:hypothetical protein